jgi:tetratricopeptide (TPR) repeat protein
MERENFYLLLELAVDPPETDLHRIETAIKKMQARWSLFRNHPTKAILAKKYIGLIPEIRRIMSDPELRDKEARAALELTRERDAKKFAAIDRHLEIRMSKGYITKEEIFKLAELHGIEETAIRNRIRQKQREKIVQLDKHLNIRASKGYVTVEDVAKLAKLLAISEEVVRKRVKVPIRKGGGSQKGHAKPLDKAIEKVILANLKVVGKKSLYAFLDASNGAPIEELQLKAKTVEAHYRQIARKDAATTASEILAGQCLQIFKTEESRQSYDYSRARSKLKALNADIDVAGLDGEIKPEYFEVLVKTAMDYGMDNDEARAYIEDYCRQKNWAILTPKKAATRLKRVLAASLLVLVLLAAAGGGSFWMLGTSRAKADFGDLMARVDGFSDLEKKELLLQNYLATHEGSKYTSKIREKLLAVRQTLEDVACRQAVDAADAQAEASQPAEALAIYQALSRQYAGTPCDGILNDRLRAAAEAVEDEAFKGIQAGVLGEVDQRVAACQAYLEAFPQGRHRDAVRRRLGDMSEEYYLALEKQLKAHREQGQWAAAISLCKRFIDLYPGNPRNAVLEGLQDSFQRNLRGEEVLTRLSAKAAAAGDDLAGARAVYADYLKAYPNSGLRPVIQEKITALEQRALERKRQAAASALRTQLAAAGGRFQEKKPGTVLDTRTGLTWCLLDSRSDTGQCLDYAAAERYVEGLTVGGFSDWRLPTADELAGIHEKAPRFPAAGGAEWYWTSKNYTRYSDGWSRVVDVVSVRDETNWRVDQMADWQCGTVRAVRR